MLENMISNQQFREMALSFAEASEIPHFQKTSFRVNKKIFATLDENSARACLPFSEIDQSVFITFDKSVIYPVPNKWGKQGWTFIELQKIEEETMLDALKAAYRKVAPKRLGNLYPFEL